MSKIKFLILSICLLFFVVNSSFATTVDSLKKENGFISLSSSQEKEVEPNLLNIVFSVENTSSEAVKATNENKLISNSIISELKLLLTEPTDKINTTNFNVRPVYSNTPTGKRIIKNYTAINSVSVETRNIHKASVLIDKAISLGANSVSGLNYSFDDEKKVCRELYPQIVSDLKLQASILAKAAGTSLDGLKHLNASCNATNPVNKGRVYAKSLMMDSSASVETVSTPIEVGKVKIRAYVNSEFYVK